MSVFRINVLGMAILAPWLSISQMGPAGVSNETGTDSNCKMWLDADELTLGDGASVASWPDISLSVNANTPTQTNTGSQPTFRSDLSASINGHPILRFLPAQYLQLVSSSDINTSGPYTERTTFLAFRTGSDVTTRQMLWEQGGAVRGLNVFIFNGDLYFGGYDLSVDGDGTPSWGYTFTQVPVLPSTPYIVTHVFDGPLGNTTGTISGFLNGQTFALLNPGPGDPASGVGSLWDHPDAPGLGAINNESYNELGPVSGSTGQQPFLGDMAEFIAYDEILNDAERIIVENYLGAKYFANLVLNDYFDYQVTYGTEVIGIGRDQDAADVHNTAQGRNLFQIEGNTAEFANSNQEYFLVGHNNGDASTWTVTNAPNNGVNSLRLTREWRADHTGNVGDITFQIDVNDLPTLISGYTKYCLIVDKSGGSLSDFNSSSTEIIEMSNTSGSLYSTDEPIPNGSFITIGIVDPAVQFTNANDFGFELTPVGTDNSVAIDVELNYRPATDVNVDFSYTDNTAIFGPGPPPGVDYFNVAPGTGFITIPSGAYTNQITFDILGDSDSEATEDFMLALFLGSNTTAGLEIGSNNTNTFSIFDDDNTPKVGFSAISSAQIENAGVVNIQILRSGNTVPAVSVDYQLKVAGGAGTATDGVDYTYISGTASFGSGVTSVDMPITINDDLLDEPDETIIFELVNNVNADILSGFKDHTATITDNDSPPEVQFVLSASQGPELLGSPFIEVQLSAQSSQVVEIDYENMLTGSATAGTDYTIATTGPIIFSPGDTLEILPLFVVNDAIAESDETIDFELDVATAVNCTPLGNTMYTYTIKDYSSFEWTGAAGVGEAIDNIMWLKASDLVDVDGANVQDFVDSSPNGNVVTQGTSGNQPNMDFSGPNSQKQLVFNGTTDLFDINDNANINTNPFYQGKHFSIVFSTETDVSSRQMVYEQGGATRGISIYIESGQLYFHIWNNSDDNGANSAWGVGSSTGAFFVSSGANTIAINSTYIATLNYQIDSPNGTLTGYLNGENIGSVTLSTPSGVDPRLYSHGDNGSIGGVIGNTRYTDNASNVTYFDGAVQELIYFSDAPLNETRRLIIENHLSTKYDVDLFGSAQYYATSYATTYNNELAGIGQFGSDDNHPDAKGTGMVRINNPSSLNTGDYLMWAHDGASLTLGLLPYVEYIPNISNRLHRVWKASELGGDVGEVTIRFYLDEISGFSSFDESNLVLLIDNDDGNFTNCTQIEIGRTYNSTSGELVFTGVNFNHDVWFTVGSKASAQPLPIDLLSFEANLIGEQVKLAWSTASELDNHFFTIERSADGENWKDIVQMNGAGTSNVLNTYAFWDNKPIRGVSYYRLAQTDIDGTKTYSQIRSVVYGMSSDCIVFPNPTSENVTILYDQGFNMIYMYNAMGQPVISQNIEGTLSSSLDISTLPKGLYFLRLVGTNQILIKELIVN